MVRALVYGFPAALNQLAPALGLGVVKDKDGRRLMKQMAKPRKTPKGADPNGLHWFDEDYRLDRLVAYCRQDVRTEKACDDILPPLDPSERELWHRDFYTNQRGVRVDVDSAKLAMPVIERETSRIDKAIYAISGGAIPNAKSNPKFLAWVRSRGVATNTVDKAFVKNIIDYHEDTTPPDVVEALTLRRGTYKSSVAKIPAIINTANADKRVRGLLQYHGATTGRWAGRGLQVHNLPRTPEDFNSDAMVKALQAERPEAIFNLVHGQPLDCLFRRTAVFLGGNPRAPATSCRLQ